MKKLLLSCAVGVMLASCGGPGSFKVEVNDSGLGTQLMTVAYSLPDGNHTYLSVPAVDGKFSFEGSSSEPSLIEIYTASNKRFYAATIAANGDEVRLVSSGDGKCTVSGNDLAVRLQRLSVSFSDTTDYSSQPEIIAAALKSIYSNARRTGWPIFTPPQLFVHTDSLVTLSPEGIWVFTADEEERTPALIDTLRAYNKARRPVRDVWIGSDTAAWRIINRRDSAVWLQAMLPDAPVRLKDILRSTPALVEVDTAGHVIRVHNFE